MPKDYCRNLKMIIGEGEGALGQGSVSCMVYLGKKLTDRLELGFL